MTPTQAQALTVGFGLGAVVCIVCIACVLAYAWAEGEKARETALTLLLALLGGCLWGLVWLRWNGWF